MGQVVPLYFAEVIMAINQELFEKIKKCIDHFFDINGYSPSVRDISVVIGTPKSTVQRYLDSMRKMGIIKDAKYTVHRWKRALRHLLPLQIEY